MNRYAPELALVTGGLLGSVFGGFVLFSVREFYSAAIVAAVCCYPFAAYAVHNDDDPTTVLPPWLCATLGGLAAVGIVLDVVRLFGSTLQSLLFGLFLGLLVFLPVAAYATGYGSPPAWLAPRWVEAGCTLLAFGLLAGGIYTGAAVAGSASALLVFVAGTVFAAQPTGLTPRRQRLLPIGGVLLAAGLLAVGVATAGSLDPWVTASLAAVFGPLISVAVTGTVGM